MEQNTQFSTEVSRRYSKALLRVANEDNSEQKSDFTTPSFSKNIVKLF